ncbi:MAG: Pre-mRNA splicing factor-domain-containing protein [Linnemannia gamsii]|nr:MAG: Pre-mRNA splicing factor-domain-containing protein [Linnemannia gamsii]
MGGGDLNLKKSWHPGTFKNQERVWKEERKAADEDKKIQQMRKELEEERQIQELQRIQEQAGGKKRGADRLDWMYQAAPTAGARDEKDQEDYLLGKKSVEEILKQKAAAAGGGMKSLSKDADFLKQMNKANSVKDLQAKVREDPLLAIKRREQASLEMLMKNPIKMRQLKESKEGGSTRQEPRHRPRSRSPMRKDTRRHSRSRSPVRQDPRRRSRSRSPVRQDTRRRSRSRSPVRQDTRRRSPPPPSLSRRRSRSRSPQYERPSQARNASPPRRDGGGYHSRQHDRAQDRPQDRKQDRQQDREQQQQSHAEELAQKRAALEEDRARRLKAMTDDANAETVARKARLAEIAEIEAKQDAEEEAKRVKSFSGGQASFMKSAQKAAYNGSMSLADRVQRGRTTLRKD